MTTTTSTIRPMMGVYTPLWEFLGYIEDRGTKASERMARVAFAVPKVRLVPGLVDRGED